MLSKTLVLAAIAAVASAQQAVSTVLSFTRVPNPITDGEPQALTYATNDTFSPVTIILRKGLSTNLQTVETLTTDAVGGQFVWTPKASLPNGNDYALEIRQNSQINYFGPFTVQGATEVASSSSNSSSASSSSSTSSSNATVTAAPGVSSNSTITSGAVGTGSSAGTGSALPRNTTMSMATLSATTNTVSTTTTADTGFQSTSASTTGNMAVSDIQSGGLFAAVLGVAAAALL